MILEHEGPLRRHWLGRWPGGLLLALLILVVYGQALSFQFIHYDDPAHTYENPVVMRGLTLEGLKYAFTATLTNHWHPLTWLSHMADWQLYGPWAGGQHLTSVLLHLAASLLLWRFMLETAPGANGGLAWAVAAIFALHPLHVESVAWVSARKDVLSAVFWMLGMLLYARHCRLGGWKYYAGLSLCLVVGFMAKGVVLLLVPSLFILDLWPLQRTGLGVKRLLLEKLPLLALALLMAMIVFAARYGEDRGVLIYPLYQRAVWSILAYGEYLHRFVWPSDLAIPYQFPDVIRPTRIILTLTILAAISLTAFRLRRAAPWLAAGWLWFCGLIFPLCGLLPLRHTFIADRYAYLPLLGLTWIVVSGAGAVTWTRRETGKPAQYLLAGGLAILLTAAAVATLRQTAYWRDSGTLFTHTLATNPRSEQAMLGLAAWHMEHQDWKPAVRHLERLIELQPNFAPAYAALGVCQVAGHDLIGAEMAFRRAVALDPGEHKYRFQLGMLLSEAGSHVQAREHLEAARGLHPGNAAFQHEIDQRLSRPSP